MRPFPPLQALLRSRRFIAAVSAAALGLTGLWLYRQHLAMVSLCSVQYPQLRSLYAQNIRLERSFNEVDWSPEALDSLSSEARRALAALPETKAQLEGNVESVKAECSRKGYFKR